MSFYLTSYVIRWAYKQADPGDQPIHLPSDQHFRVLLVLCDMADDKLQECWPSYDLIHYRTSYSREFIAKILRELKRDKLITIKKRYLATPVYRVTIKIPEAFLKSCRKSVGAGGIAS